MIIERFCPWLRSAGAPRTLRVVIGAIVAVASVGATFGAAGSRPANAPIETTLYDLPQGSEPWTAPFVASDGTLYGTTTGSGIGFGTAFKLTPPRAGHTAWSDVVLANFTGRDGYGPDGGVAAGRDGSLFGTTFAGGAGGVGVVFRLTPPAKGQYYWSESVLHTFGARGDGSGPYAGTVVSGVDGSLYGTTTSSAAGFCGTAFKLTPPPHRNAKRWTETNLHDFGGAGDGCQPFAGLVPDGLGGFYGTAVDGGIAGCYCGVVYQLTPPKPGSSTWAETILYAFNGQAAGDGSAPYATLALDRNGDLYGTTQAGGTANMGTVFELVPSAGGSGQWTETVLHSFTGPPDGASPWSPVTVGAEGNVYGTAFGGFTANDGVVFMLIPPRRGMTAWREKILHLFGGPDGRFPYAGLTFGPDGALYGATFEGGTFDGGTVFRIAPFNGDGDVARDPEGAPGEIAYVVNAQTQTLSTYATGGTKPNEPPIATIGGPDTGLMQPTGVAADGAGNIYVANGYYPGSIEVFAADLKGHIRTPPLAVISGGSTGIASPVGVALDAAGRIYVANNSGYSSTVTVYAAHPRGNVFGPPLATISGSNTDLHYPQAIALGPRGEIYVVNSYGTDYVTAYAADPAGLENEAPHATIGGGSTGLSGADAIAVDAGGEIYVANQTPSEHYFGSVTVYAAHPRGNVSGPPLAVMGGVRSGIAFPHGVALDAGGQVYVTGEYDNSVTVYAAHPVGKVTGPPMSIIHGRKTGLVRPVGIVIH